MPHIDRSKLLSPREQQPRPGFSRRAVVVSVLSLFVLTAVPYGLSVRNRLWGDEGMFAYMAWASAATGKPLYHVGRDSKPPGIFYLYKTVQAYDAQGVGRARLLQGFLVFLTAVILLWWIGKAVSVRAGFFAALSLVLLMVYLPGGIAMTEPPLAFCTTLGFYLLYSGWRTSRWAYFILAGIAFAVAFNFKQVAIAELIAAVLVLLLASATRSWRQRSAQVGVLLAGFGGVCGLVLLYLWGTGQFSEFWQSTVVWLLNGSYPLPEGGRIACALRFWRYPFSMMQVLAMAALLACIAPVGTRAPKLRLFLGLWLVFAALGFLASGHASDRHAPQFFPPLSALGGVGIAWMWHSMMQSSRTAKWVGAAVLLLLVFGPLADRYRIRLQQHLTFAIADAPPEDEQLGSWLAQRIPSTDKMYVVGAETGLYVHTQRLSPTPYFHTILLTTPTLQANAIRDLLAESPAAIVFTRLIGCDYFYQFDRKVREQVIRGRYVEVETGLPVKEEVYLRQDLLPRLGGAEAMSTSASAAGRIPGFKRE